MPTRTHRPKAGPRPLLVTGDPDLLDDLLRLAAAAPAQVEVAADPAAARTRWSAAPLVVIGADQTADCLRARLPRRCEVVLVGRSDATDPPWESAELLGAAHVAMLPEAEPWLVDRFAEHADPGRRPGRILAVLGGRGGAGASVLAAGLAVTAVRNGLHTLLVDADPYGGGLDLVLGWEQVDGLRWPALAGTTGRLDPAAFLSGLPGRGDLVLLSFDRGEPLAVPVEAMAATLEAGRRGRDLVVVDLSRQLDDAAGLALQAADRAVLVVPAELRATAAAMRMVARASAHCSDLSVVVRGPAPGRLKAGEIARSLDLPLAGSLRPEPDLARALERGEPPAGDGRGPLAALCRRILDELAAPARVPA